jgi:hypothetical protein
MLADGLAACGSAATEGQHRVQTIGVPATGLPLTTAAVVANEARRVRVLPRPAGQVWTTKSSRQGTGRVLDGKIQLDCTKLIP